MEVVGFGACLSETRRAHLPPTGLPSPRSTISYLSGGSVSEKYKLRFLKWHSMHKRTEFSNGYVECFRPKPLSFVISAAFHRLLLYSLFIAIISIFDLKYVTHIKNFATTYIIFYLLNSIINSRSIYYIITSRSVNIAYANLFFRKIKQSKLHLQRYSRDEVEFIYDYRFFSIISILNFNILGKHYPRFLFGKQIGMNIDDNEKHRNFKYYTKKSNSLFPRNLTLGMSLKNTIFGIKEMGRLSELLKQMKLRS